MANEYVKENDTFNTSRNGTVPKPTQAEVTAGKVLKADGTWGEGGGGGNVDDVYVNGESVLDENKIAQVTSYKELTLAEYMALPDTKINDGVMYCIKDIGGANQFPPLIYSDEEREVGVWRDGKPLYQKTIYCGNLPNKTTKTIAHNISNLEKVYDISGVCIYSTYSTTVPKIHDASANNQIVFEVGVTNISIASRNLDSSAGVCYLTLQYTKITDTPGSGTWTTDGTYAKHYSTEEKVIGTWIDGKPLYEKTFASTNSSRAVEWDISTLNIETVVSQKGSWCRKYNSNNKIYWYNVDFIASADASYRAVTNVSLNDNVLISTIDMPTGNTILYRAVTIQYTKTTD